MGYRSQVHFTVVGKHDDMTAAIIAFRMLEPGAANALANCCLLQSGEETALKFYGDNWKWCEGYGEVKLLTRLFRSFNEDHMGQEEKFSGSFVRVGEDDDDVESREFGPDAHGLEQVQRIVESRFAFDPDQMIGKP